MSVCTRKLFFGCIFVEVGPASARSIIFYIASILFTKSYLIYYTKTSLLGIESCKLVKSLVAINM